MSEEKASLSSAFYTSDHITDGEKIESDTIELDPSSPEFEEFFEIQRILIWIKTHGYHRVALQLPDNLLAFAFTLARRLEDESGAKMYILADTSYRSCCVDAVAAEHAVCDSLIHFGEACMSAPTTAIPVLYVFGKLQVDFDDLKEKVKNSLRDADTEVVLLYEPGYESVSDKLEKTIRELINDTVTFSTCHLSTSESTNTSLGRKLPLSWNSDAPAALIFIGNHQSALLPIWLLTHPRFAFVINYYPGKKTIECQEPKSTRSLRKRLFLIEKLRDADVIGLVVGTLGVEGVKEAIARVRQLCKEVNKKIYVLAIGKVNEPKLSNFAADIDAFVLLSCPFGIILDSSDFFKPIVSLFEAEIALNPSKEWFAAGGWSAQFSDFIKDDIGKLDKNATDVSLISGKIRAVKLDEEATEDGNAKDKQVIQFSTDSYFAKRSWKGLDNTDVEQDMTLGKGLSGIAMEYSSEPPPS